MLDGEENVEIAWEGARQRAGRTGNRGNSWRRASLTGRERDSMGQSDYSMLDGEETVQIACGELGGSETACWTERKPCK